MFKIVEKMLIDLYGYYKNSPKRKRGLVDAAAASTRRQRVEKEIDTLKTEMNNSIEHGKPLQTNKINYVGENELKKLPSLRLKRWNATRWLGRHECLKALCGAYPFVLDHLRSEMVNSSNTKEVRAKAEDLYRRLRSYDTLLCIHFYRDITWRMAVTSQQLQRSNLQMSHIGNYIIALSASLKTHYSQDKECPEDLLGEGHTDGVIRELFNLDPNVSLRSISLIGILVMN